MRVLYISEVQWLSQVSRKHQFVSRFPDEWETLFLSPVNARGGENSFRTRRDQRHASVSYASLPLPKPDSALAPVRSLTGILSGIGLRAVMSSARSFQPDVVVCSYIWAAPLVPRLRELGVPVIYDCNDLHTEFYPACPDVAERLFKDLIAGATEVVCSSGRLREVCGRGVVVGNGVDLETFVGKRDGPRPELVAGSPLRDCAQLITYVGSVDDRIDFDILEAVAAAAAAEETRTGVLCLGRVFRGAKGRAEALAERYRGSIFFAGRVPYEELPVYLSHARVGIAPFIIDERTKAINPNKLYMYAAMEQNVVSTPFSSDITEHEDLIYIAEDPGAFTRAVLDALGDDERRRVVRERLALPNDWNEKAKAFREVLTRTVSGGRQES